MEDSGTVTCTATSDNLGLSDQALETFDIASWSCSRPLWDDEYCVWHADAVGKPPDDLAATIGDGDLHGARVSASDLSSICFPDDTGLVAADLSDANLFRTDLSGGDLRDADLSGARLTGADLSDANLREADLSEARLTGTDISDTHLREIKLADATLARSTQIGSPGERIKKRIEESRLL